MPEGDSLKLTADRLNQALAGAPLVRAELRWPSLGGIELRGLTIKEVVPYGKNTLFRLSDDRTLHTHLRMDGHWRVARTGTRDAGGNDPKYRAVLANSTWTALGWLLGMMNLVRTADEGRLLGHLGPDVLAPDFAVAGVDEAVRRFFAADVARPLCVALMDQQMVAGIGTIWMAESLCFERIYPWTMVAELDSARLRRLLLTASRLMSRSVATARSRGLGADGMLAHGRHHKPCRRCGALIALGATTSPDKRPDQGVGGERVVYWCPRCQAPGRAVV